MAACALLECVSFVAVLSGAAMFISSIRLALIALPLAFVIGCHEDNPPAAGAPAVSATVGASAPDVTIRTNVALLKAGNFGALVAHALPPAEFAKLKADWGKEKDNEPITEEDRQKFNATLAKLTAPDAEQRMFSEIQPALAQFDAQYKQQLPMYVNMGRGFVRSAVQESKEMSDASKQQALAAIDALADWAQGTRFTDPDKIKAAIAVLVATARDLKLTTLDAARTLDFDQSMQKAQTGFLGVKRLLDVYGFSIDKTLDSITPTVISADGNSAKVKIDYSLLDKPLSAEVEMVRLDGQWYGKETIEKMQKRLNEAAATPSESATDKSSGPAD